MARHSKSAAKKDYKYGGVITEIKRSEIYALDYTVDGERVRERFRGTKTAAAEYMKQQIEKARSGIDLTSGKVSFGKYCTDFFAALGKSGVVRDSTIQHYETVQKKIATVPKFWNKSVDSITSNDVNSLYTSLKKAGTGATTLHHVHVQVKRIFSAAIEDHLIRFTPVNRNVNVPPLPEPDRHALTRQEAARLRDALFACQPAPFNLAAMIALSTGLRIGEILALQWCDVFMGAEPHFMVTKQIPKSGKVTERKTSKSGKKPNPWVPLDPFLINVLKAWRQYQYEVLLANEVEQTEETPICANALGGWPDPHNIRNRFCDFCIKNNFAEYVTDEGTSIVHVEFDEEGNPSRDVPEDAIGEYYDCEGWPVDENGRRYSRSYPRPRIKKHYKGLKFHELRRTNFTLRLDGGESLKTLQAHGGWFSPRMLLETYSESVDESVRVSPHFLESLSA